MPMNKYKTSKWVKTHKLTISEALILLENCKRTDNGDPLRTNGISKAQMIDKFKTEVCDLLDVTECPKKDITEIKPELARRIIQNCL